VAFAERSKDSASSVDAELPGAFDLAVTFTDACHLAHGQRIRAEPRRLLGANPD